MDPQENQLIERIHQAQNILVTVSSNPTVDQLSAAIGLTLTLNKMEKHGTAVFSGRVPSTIEFLKPEETLEKNTDSLRDFIIALDKSKADKLRYKVEDQVVRIFITPYKTSLSEKDLEFSQGDFNVDVVVALGVTEQQDLDTAITAHGRILHDATVVSVSTMGQGSLGSINWVDPKASSLSEMVASLVRDLDKKAMDGQIATALLTGIVATTERFRNDKTSPRTMTLAAELMGAGANQQLIASELETPPAAPEAPVPQEPTGGDQPDSGQGGNPFAPPEKPKEPGTLEINHEEKESEPALEEPEPRPEPNQPQVRVDENGQLITEGTNEASLPEISQVRGVSSDGKATESGKTEVKREIMVEPPKLGGSDLTANASPDDLDPTTEELTLPALDAPLLTHNESVLKPDSQPAVPLTPPQPPALPFTPPAPAPAPFTPPPVPGPQQAPLWQPSQPPMPQPFTPETTLSDIEKSVSSPHLQQAEPAKPAADQDVSSVEDARSAVEAALNSSAAPQGPLPPISALNAQPLGPELRAETANEQPAAPAPFTPPAPSPVMSPAPLVPNTGFNEPTPGNSPADQTLDMPLPSNPFGPSQQPSPFTPPVTPPGPAPQAPPSMFPGTPPPPASGQGGQTPPPPVPPPMLPPLQ